MVGKCSNCGRAIFEMKNGEVTCPLGNYRTLTVILESGSELEVPLCISCHNDFIIENIDKFHDNLEKYMEVPVGKIVRFEKRK